MKTERDLFREWYENAYHEIIHILPSGQYASLRQQHSWEAWTASTQREGYKLVPVKINDEIESAMFSSVVRGEMPSDIYKAMLGVSK